MFDNHDRPGPARISGRIARRTVLAGGVSLTALAACGTVQDARSGNETASAGADWRVYGGTNAANKYSPLDQINAQNVNDLQIAWEWVSPDIEILEQNPDLKPGEFQATPIMADGVLYTSTAMCQVAAINPETGVMLWRFDPQTWKAGPPTSKGFQHRGVAYWGEGADARVIIATGDNRLIALGAKSGRPVEAFGSNGEVNLAGEGLQRPLSGERSDVFASTSPPLICRDTIVVGQYIHDREVEDTMPPGDVRGYDVRTGALKWSFHTIPTVGEFGSDTWENQSAARTGNANIWAPMSADDELGMVYLPGSCPTNNFFGGDRPGDNLFGNALIALDAETGKRVWHYQIVHHDIWDYDLPCAPILADIVVEGRSIKAVAQPTKQGFCFVFDRVTGEPVWPIEERPVPRSKIAGERAAPTQPFPTRPAPFERQGLTDDDLIDFTPEILGAAREVLSQYQAGPLYTPLGEKPTTVLPSWVGGANWWGAALDPDTGVLYIPSITAVVAMAIDQGGDRTDAADGEVEIAGRSTIVRGPQGLPLVKPPYGRITAIDLNSGEHIWMRPNGPGAKDDPAFAPFDPGWVGTTSRTGPLLTSTLLFMGEGPHNPRTSNKVLRAYDKATGEVRGEIALPDHTHGPPMTYMSNGRQYIVCGMGFRRAPHRLVALALP